MYVKVLEDGNANLYTISKLKADNPYVCFPERISNSILQEFGRSVVESSVQIRHLVTNKLLLETDNPDPRVRIRALELLGKISDVGLFAEKSEVTITHQSTDDLREKLRSKLAKLVNPANEVENAVVIDGEPLNVDEELGLDSE